MKVISETAISRTIHPLRNNHVLLIRSRYTESLFILQPLASTRAPFSLRVKLALAGEPFVSCDNLADGIEPPEAG